MATHSGDGQLTIAIENDGKGLSQEHKARLFEPFSTFSQHGNGLGLWVCYQIVTQLKGTIRAETTSTLTRFVVALPLNPQGTSQ